MIKNYISIAASLFFICSQAVQAGDIHGKSDPYLKRFITVEQSKKSGISTNNNFAKDQKWLSFTKNIGQNWVAEFNQETGMPHRAYGSPIELGSQESTKIAGAFILKNFLSSYITEGIQLKISGTNKSPKYSHINYIQQYKGLDILWSRVMLKLTADNSKFVAAGLDLHPSIQLSIQPSISEIEAENLASAEILAASKAENKPVLKVLPLSIDGQNIYKLVYEITVATKDIDGTPARYYTLLDANDGKIYYRSNKVQSFAPADIKTKGVIYPKNPYTPTGIANIPYVDFTIAGVPYASDVNGDATVNVIGTQTGNFKIEGEFAKIFRGTSGVAAPSFNKPVIAGINTIPYDSTYTIRDLSAYYHTNIVHDFLKSKFPEFLAYDFQLPVKIDRTDGTCNAFFDGTSINFYTTAGGCFALSMVADVIYHEYGHGITNYFWDDNGLSFDNGAMGEAYSDIWAVSITNDPVLGIGFSSTDPTDFVRRYDIDKRAFPQDIAGQVHNDGQIIAGCWWDLALNLSSTPLMSNIFAESHYGLANGPDGAEGQVYSDILIDALFADDDDANITNGTPNYTAIIDAFNLHGINFLTNATLSHVPVGQANGLSLIPIQAVLTNLLTPSSLGAIKVFYQVNNDSVWLDQTMSNGGAGSNFSTDLPGQPDGSIIKYYITMEGTAGNTVRVLPFLANDANPNLPYFIKVGFTQLAIEDFDANQNTWIAGLPGDNATTGKWILAAPVQSTITNSGTIVQPSVQQTLGGSKCAVTGNGSIGGDAGVADIDGGKTTLQSPVFDLSTYINPVISYYRWYSNDQGATPGTDFWKVQISNDGINYIDVENTNIADHSYRENVIRVANYLIPTSTVTMRFTAEDAGLGSLVEALVDDLTLNDAAFVGINSTSAKIDLSVYPNPAAESFIIKFPTDLKNNMRLSIIDNTGKLISDQILNSGQLADGFINISVRDIANGLYTIKLQGNDAIAQRKLTVIH